MVQSQSELKCRAMSLRQQRSRSSRTGSWETGSPPRSRNGECSSGMLLPHARTQTHTRAPAHTHLIDVLQSRRTGKKEVMRWRDRTDRIRLVNVPDTLTCAKTTCESVGFHHTNTRFTLISQPLDRHQVSHTALTQCVSTIEGQKRPACHAAKTSSHEP